MLTDPRKELHMLILETIVEMFPEIESVLTFEVKESSRPEFGHYTTNAALQAAQRLRKLKLASTKKKDSK